MFTVGDSLCVQLPTIKIPHLTTIHLPSRHCSHYSTASISVAQHCYQRTADKSHPQKPSFPQATQLPALATISTYQNKPRLPSSNNTAISVSPTSAATGNLPSTTFTTANPVSSHHTHPTLHKDQTHRTPTSTSAATHTATSISPTRTFPTNSAT